MLPTIRLSRSAEIWSALLPSAAAPVADAARPRAVIAASTAMFEAPVPVNNGPPGLPSRSKPAVCAVLSGVA